MVVPTNDDLFNPLLKAMHNLGGSASISEQEDEVASILGLTEKEVSEIHRGNRTKFGYRLAWARNYLKHYGLLDNSAREVWSLTAKGRKTTSVDKKEVKKSVKGQNLKAQRIKNEKTDLEEPEETVWTDKLLDVIKELSPDAFERLCQRLLRESGFVHVEVTGRSGDGEIDGKGIVRIGGLLSFHMIFQCKRFKGCVSSPIVRDFRGAMIGRADKGLLITTGTFTKDARTEAQRDGAPPIDLVDGQTLAEKLKELRLGVEVKEKVVEEVLIDQTFFNDI
jgi:restriction system protein